MKVASTRFLHVANGTSTTNTMDLAGMPGARSIWADPLYEGPVPDVSDEELLEVRKRYLSSEDEDIDPMIDLRTWRQMIAAHDAYDELVLWYEHDLFDQLNLIQVLGYIRARVPAVKPVSLICIGSFPGRPDFKGLGELTPDELAPLLETRQRVDDRQYDVAERAWKAFRAPTPEPLEALRHSDLSPLPFLAPALERFLQDYPWTVDGLSRTERRLLQLAEEGPINVSAVFPRMHVDEVYHVSDLSLAFLVDTLARTSPPLLASAPRQGAVGPMAVLRGTVSLTEAGREVLSGRRDRVALGIDRWLGGVHLHDGADLWRWDDRRRTVTRR